MAMRLTVNGIDSDQPGITVQIAPGTAHFDAIRQMGASTQIDYVPDESEHRKLSEEAARFITTYEPEEADSVLAVYWSHHSLYAEEFDTAEQAERYLDSGEDFGYLAGEAVVDADGTIHVRP